jgi:hypothetical protein
MVHSEGLREGPDHTGELLLEAGVGAERERLSSARLRITGLPDSVMWLTPG